MAASVRASIQINNGMTPALKSMQQALNLTISSFERLQSATDDPVNLSAIVAAKSKLADVAVAVDGVEQELQQSTQESENLKASMKGLGGLNLKGILGGLGIGAAIKEVVELSDTYAQTYARLNLINDGLQTTSQLQTAIYNSAQRSRSAYQDTAAEVSKLGLLAGDAFSSIKEIVAFTELMNKNFKIAGASSTEQAAAMYQLTQAMASGRLQGDEYRSIIENAPLLAKAIEDYMVNVQHAEGSMKDWASEGKLTADVIKAALFSTADEVDERFSQLPMTWSDVWTQVENEIIRAMEPVLQFINFLANNWSSIEPYVIWILSTAAAFGILTAAISLAKLAHDAFKASLLTSPIGWIALLIGMVIMLIVKWIQSVGGLKIAWMSFKDSLLSIIEDIQLKIKSFTTNVENAFANLSARVQLNWQNLVNGVIDGLNFLRNASNDILNTSFKMIDHYTFGTEATLEVQAKTAANDAELDNLKMIITENRSARSLAIYNAQAEAAADGSDSDFNYSQTQADISSTANNTGSISDSLEKTDEYLELLTDIAEREAINRFTTAEVKVDFTTNANISSDMDIDGVMNIFEEKLQEAMDSSAEGVYA
ncbi:MAG: tape measure protein [Candidatus Metalachnospira sp.]|nr:tape measure protein [Candidatus Metalachnospira sp.]